MNSRTIKLVLMLSVLFLLTTAAQAQQTPAFTYQGKLTDTGTMQSTYQMRFELYDALTGGGQVGATITNNSVAVTQGVFTVNLDLGATAFNGADRFLEISVKRGAGDPFSVLTPRQQITSAPYSAQSVCKEQ